MATMSLKLKNTKNLRDMIITTTNSIENSKVERYLGVVTTNLVIGTGVFSDFSASLTDFFGGMSNTYRKHMDELYCKAYDLLSMKASVMGANAILGFKIDFDEISGKNMQMFMVSVSGTAVKIKTESNKPMEASKGAVSATRLNVELFKANWAKRDKRQQPTHEEIDFIMDHGLWEMAPSLYDYYVMPRSNDNEIRPIDDKFPIIVSSMSYDELVSFIYNDYNNRAQYAYKLIKENKLFNASKVLFVLAHADNLADAIKLLDTEKREYTTIDLQVMEEIVAFFDHLPDKGSIENMKSGLLSSKMVDMYICPNGHKNNADVEFCEHNNGTCSLNIKGLTRKQAMMVNTFKEKVEMLKSVLRSK